MLCVQNASRLLFGILNVCAARKKTGAAVAAVMSSKDDASPQPPAPSLTAESSSSGTVPPEAAPAAARQVVGRGVGAASSVGTGTRDHDRPEPTASRAGDPAATVVIDGLASADDFLPTLIYAVLQARPDQLHSNLAYVQEYRDSKQVCACVSLPVVGSPCSLPVLHPWCGRVAHERVCLRAHVLTDDVGGRVLLHAFGISGTALP